LHCLAESSCPVDSIFHYIIDLLATMATWV
jgi:hypothetical protein